MLRLEEVNVLYTCEFSRAYAPVSCMITCEGIGGGVDNGSDDSPISCGDGEGNDGSDKNANDEKDKNADDEKEPTTAASATSTMVALYLSASTLLVLAAITL